MSNRGHAGRTLAGVAEQQSDAWVGRRNAYRCPECGGYTVTIDVDPGVTPSHLGCRASGNVGDCPGVAVSRWYPLPQMWPEDAPTEPGWEWYRPTDAAVRTLDRGQWEHVREGGLMLRKRPDHG